MMDVYQLMHPCAVVPAEVLLLQNFKMSPTLQQTAKYVQRFTQFQSVTRAQQEYKHVWCSLSSFLHQYQEMVLSV
jgi:hypothetical protein